MNKEQKDVKLKKDNPTLFLLYVQWGVGHLACIDDCLKRLNSHHNLNMFDAIDALYKARVRLVKEQEVYTIADRILQGVRNKKYNFQVEAI